MPHHQITVEYSDWLPHLRSYTVEDDALAEQRSRRIKTELFTAHERIASVITSARRAADELDKVEIVERLRVIRGAADITVGDDGLWVRKFSDAPWSIIDFGVSDLLCARFDWTSAETNYVIRTPNQLASSFIEELEGINQLARLHQMEHLLAGGNSWA